MASLVSSRGKTIGFDGDGFNAAAMPPTLTKAQLQLAIQYIEETAEEWVDIYEEQRNVFSAVIGILGTKALDIYSRYKKNPHKHHAASRFPDLQLRGKTKRPRYCLESKGSTRPWQIQAHYDHAGWYLVWRYFVDPTRKLVRGKGVVVWRVDTVPLKKSDWVYQKSRARSGAGGRTHTFGVQTPKQKIAPTWVSFQLPGFELQGGQPARIPKPSKRRGRRRA